MTLSELRELSLKNPIILYDGVCVLCERFIQEILNTDKNEFVRFHLLQNSDEKQLETVVLLHQGNRFEKSDVVIQLNKLIALNKYKWIKYLPKFVRDFGYSRIANNRYRWFGKKESCLLPPSFPQHLFLD